MAVAVLFGEQESGEQVNCVVSSMHQAGPLYPQLLTYRCGAANRRFGPITEVVPVRIDLSDSAFHEIRAAISFGDAAYGDH